MKTETFIANDSWNPNLEKKLNTVLLWLWLLLMGYSFSPLKKDNFAWNSKNYQKLKKKRLPYLFIYHIYIYFA